jgi:DNA-directed RNA polymerase specialized sigma24 family protein
MSDRHFIKKHKIKEVRGPNDAYGKWCEKHPTLRANGRLGNRFDVVKEDTRANPDSLREDEAMYVDSQPSNPQLLMGEAIQHLQGRQKECYLLTMREDKSLAEVAEILGISKGAVQIYRQRAVKFLTSYCKVAIKNGRV